MRPDELQSRWEEHFPRTTSELPPPAFSPWQAQDRVLADLRLLPDLMWRIRDQWRQFRQEQAHWVRASRAQRPMHAERAREHFFQACVLAQPVAAPHFPVGWDLWNETRSVVVALCLAEPEKVAAPPALFG